MPLLAVFFLSGASALVLQTVFLRQATWLLGSAASATAATLAAFLGGLALGAAAFGRRADRVERPLRLYGLLEIGAGAAAALVVGVLGYGRGPLFAAAAALPQPAGSAFLFVAAAALFLVPTTLLGGTLPALVRHATRDPGRLLTPLGVLYGINTLGGALGALLGGFVLLERLGVSTSGWLAAALSAALGSAALALDRRGGAAAALPAASGRSHERARDTAPRAAVLAAAAAGGFCALGYEVLWTRLLALPLRSYAYSFATMLALFLIGLVAGAAVLAAAAPRIDRPARALGLALTGMGAWVAASLIWMPEVLSPPEEAGSFWAFLLRGAIRAAPVVLPPTILSGMALPLAARLAARDGAAIGRDVGGVFAANTLGAVGGAIVAGLLLLPALGAPRALAVFAAVNACAGLGMLAAARAGTGRVAVAGIAAAACAAAIFVPAAPFRDAFLRASRGRDSLGEVLFYREGATDTVAVAKRNYGFRDPSAKSVVTNGIAMTATVLPVWRYMAAEGHLPVLLSRDPSKTLVICVGTGITLGAVASHPAVRSIDAVDLSEGILSALPLFEKENGAAFRDPRVRVAHRDGRQFLERSREVYGAITLEPPPPIVSGSVHLYTRDFYALCRRRLAPGGVVAQWLPLHAQSEASARIAARAFVESFPYVQLWLPSIRDAVLVGSDAPIAMPLERLRSAWATPATRANLEAAALETPEALLATFLLDRDGVAAWAGDAPDLTDERPRMEFFRSLGRNMTDRDIAPMAAATPGTLGFVTGLDVDPDLALRVADESKALRLYLRSETAGDPGAGIEAARVSRGTRLYRYRLGCDAHQLEALAAEDGRGREWAAQTARCERMLGGG